MSLNESPLIIGGVGGSGTRAVCNIVINAGYFMGKNLNKSLDSLDFQPFYNFGIRKYLENTDSTEIKTELKQVFLDCVSKHNTYKNSLNWGVKNPRFILVIPFLHSIFPKMKFIHVIRDGRDMAFSNNQNQTRLYGDLFVKDLQKENPLYNLRYWSIVNKSAFDYGMSELRENYLLVRFEDILEKPKEMTRKIFKFLGSTAIDYSKIISEIASPPTIGRWKLHQEELSEMSQFEKNILEKFDYH